MADKIILSTTGAYLVQGVLPSIIRPLRTLKGTSALYPANSRGDIGYTATLIGVPGTTSAYSSDWNRYKSNSSAGVDKPYLSYRICPSTSTSIADGYFVDLSMINITGLSQIPTSVQDSPNSLILTYSNTSENTITINSIAQFVTNDAYYNGGYTTYSPQTIVADNTKWYMIAVTSLVVLENPLVLEPGDVKTITINYDYSNLTA